MKSKFKFIQQNLQFIIVDDHSLFRNGFKLLLQNYYPESEILEASNGLEYIQLLEKYKPNLVFMDINMPVMDGVEATEQSLKTIPELKIVALSMFGDEAYYYRMIQAGAKGFLLKNSDIEEVIEAVENVLDGKCYFSKELLFNIIKNFNKSNVSTGELDELSGREMEILKLICLGLSNQEISEKLFISKRTVDKHRSNILDKTNSKNTAQLVMHSIKSKWIEI
ncbi:MAG: response regulator transcription factor [Ignavibacteria bacterium]|nr:response regulator transcription factor [Ignavibacteria bacterium]